MIGTKSVSLYSYNQFDNLHDNLYNIRTTTYLLPGYLRKIDSLLKLETGKKPQSTKVPFPETRITHLVSRLNK